MSGRDDLDDLGPAERDAALAGEYVLRLLDPAEAAACAAREAAEPAFAAEVARWRADLHGFDAAFAPVAPPAALRARLEARLFGAQPSAFARLWASAGLWRGLAAAATVAALWLALPAQPPVPEAPAPRLVSALAPVAAGGAEFLAVYEPEAAELRLNRVVGEAAPGRSLELWVIAEGAAPVSLGVLPADPRARVALPEDLAALLAAGAVLAVSDEEAGGSKTGVPGPVLAAGALRDV